MLLAISGIACSVSFRERVAETALPPLPNLRVENVAERKHEVVPQQSSRRRLLAQTLRRKSAAAEPKAETLTGEAAKEQLRKSGQFESLGAAFQAARYAAERIDPAGPHSRGAEYFAANPNQQLCRLVWEEWHRARQRARSDERRGRG
jgi:hypothetical protein